MASGDSAQHGSFRNFIWYYFSIKECNYKSYLLFLSTNKYALQTGISRNMDSKKFSAHYSPSGSPVGFASGFSSESGDVPPSGFSSGGVSTSGVAGSEVSPSVFVDGGALLRKIEKNYI